MFFDFTDAKRWWSAIAVFATLVLILPIVGVIAAAYSLQGDKPSNFLVSELSEDSEPTKSQPEDAEADPVALSSDEAATPPEKALPEGEGAPSEPAVSDLIEPVAQPDASEPIVTLTMTDAPALIDGVVIGDPSADIFTPTGDVNSSIQLDLGLGGAGNKQDRLTSMLTPRERIIRNFTAALRRNPNNVMALTNRGNAYASAGQQQRAIEDYSTALELNRDDAKVYANRCNAYNILGEYEKALADCDKAVELDPTHTLAFLNRGNIYSALYESERAIENYNQALALNSNFSNALKSRGAAYYNLRQYDAAIADFDKVIEMHPEEVWGYRFRAQAFFDDGKWDAAWQDFIRLSDLDPDNYFSVIWRYIAGARAGEKVRNQLSKDAKRLDLSRWPGPMIELFLKDRSPNGVLEAAQTNTAQTLDESLCEANFYIGQYHLLRGNTIVATEHFMETLTTKITGFKEYAAAEAELRRLGAR